MVDEIALDFMLFKSKQIGSFDEVDQLLITVNRTVMFFSISSRNKTKQCSRLQ